MCFHLKPGFFQIQTPGFEEWTPSRKNPEITSIAHIYGIRGCSSFRWKFVTRGLDLQYNVWIAAMGSCSLWIHCLRAFGWYHRTRLHAPYKQWRWRFCKRLPSINIHYDASREAPITLGAGPSFLYVLLFRCDVIETNKLDCRILQWFVFILQSSNAASTRLEERWMDHPVVKLALTKRCSKSLSTYKGVVFLNNICLRAITNVIAESFLGYFPHACSVVPSLQHSRN